MCIPPVDESFGNASRQFEKQIDGRLKSVNEPTLALTPKVMLNELAEACSRKLSPQLRLIDFI